MKYRVVKDGFGMFRVQRLSITLGWYGVSKDFTEEWMAKDFLDRLLLPLVVVHERNE